jgi:hypothetical protein
VRRPPLTLVLLALLGAAAPAAAVPRDERLAAVRTFAFAIGEGAAARDLSGYDLIVVDGEETTAGKVKALRAGGALVLGYLDVGSIEKGRSWFARAKPYRLDYWGDWGEWYADTSRSGYRDLLAGRVAPAMLRKGFDGLFLDNVDMIAGHRRQARGMRALVRRLAKLPGLLFAQNGEDVIGSLLGVLDGWNREDVSSTYDFDHHRYRVLPAADVREAQAELRRIAARGLLVTATDYTAQPGGAAARAAVAHACAAGAVPYVSDIGLRRVPRPPPAC